MPVRRRGRSGTDGGSYERRSVRLEATDRLKQAFQFVYEYSGHVADRMKSNYDAAIKPKQFDVGSYVLVYTPPRQQSHVYGKWKVAWQGPFRVMKRLNATNYIVKRSHRAKDFVVHGDRLRDYLVKSTRQPGRKSGKAINDRPGRTPRQLTWIRPINMSLAHATPRWQPSRRQESTLTCPQAVARGQIRPPGRAGSQPTTTLELSETQLLCQPA